MLVGGLPVGELLLVAGLAFAGDALLQGGGGFELVVVGGAPGGGELALEGVFQQLLAIDLELFAGGFKAGHALIEFGKQFLDLGDDAVLFGKRGNRQQRFGKMLVMPRIAVVWNLGNEIADKMFQQLWQDTGARLKNLYAISTRSKRCVDQFHYASVVPKYDSWQLAINHHGSVICVTANVVLPLVEHRELPAWKVVFLRNFLVGKGNVTYSFAD